ncbi:RIP metalloprotease RseP [Sulfurospirillum sp. 1307]
MGILTSLLVLSFLIFFHELGHFLAARFFGVKVEVFSIGFGKQVFSKVIGDTKYCISSIPLGGYVQMKGQDDSDPTKVSSDPDSYNVKKPWQRIVILFAGPFANFLLAFLLYIAIANIGVTKLAPSIGEISQNSPAQKIGLQKNDEILEINGEKIKSWDDLSELIKESDGKLILTIKRDKTVKNLLVTPEIREIKSIFGESIKKRILGISPSGKVVKLYFTPSQSISFAYNETLKATTLILKSLQKLVEGVIPAKDLGGVVSIVQVTAEASQIGIVALLGLTALISVNLGVLNLLPIPALDGGHIMFNIYEMIRKKPPSQAVLYRLTVAGWVLLLSLMVFTIFNDIYRIAGGHG